jgi:hypothetical protein
MNLKNTERHDLESLVVAQAALLFLAVFSLVVLAGFRGWEAATAAENQEFDAPGP